MKTRDKSSRAFEKAKKVIPAGVNSPVRAFKSVGGVPVFFSSGSGCWLTDIDNNRYLDFVNSWGPLILGHAHPVVIEAVINAAQMGTTFGAPTEKETELAELILSLMPHNEMVRLVNSGTEATMSAIRLARAYTKRELIIKFEGCYHGHCDSFLIAAGSGATTFGIPNSPGVPPAVAQTTLLARYNDIESVTTLFKQHPETIAAVIVEPIPGNMGVVLPHDGFLHSLRAITKKYNTLLIFDEVMTGFRISLGGAQSLFGIEPDITTLGKIVGGGLPIGAYCGPKEIMSHVAPQGSMYQAGTLSGNPIAVAAGLATLTLLKNNPEFYQSLEQKTQKLATGIKETCSNLDIPCVCNHIGSMLTLFFTNQASVTSYREALQCDTQRYSTFFHESLDRGVYLPPSLFESWFTSTAHTDEDIELALSHINHALMRCRNN